MEVSDPRGGRWLRCLVAVAFVCVILAAVFAPLLAARIQGGPGTVSFLIEEFAPVFEELNPGGLVFILGLLYVAAMLWLPILWLLALAGGNWVWTTLTVLLLAVDILLAVLLRRLRHRLIDFAEQ